jgi:hypothetical protein
MGFIEAMALKVRGDMGPQLGTSRFRDTRRSARDIAITYLKYTKYITWQRQNMYI